MSGTWLLALVLQATLHVSARAPAGGDGSEAQPFSAVTVALARAAAGDVVAIDTGLYEAPLVIDRALTLEGHGEVVLAAPFGAAAAVRVQADGAVLRDLSIQGGKIGLDARAGQTTLDHVSIAGQSDSGVSVNPGAAVALSQVELHASMAQAVAIGAAGTVRVDGARIDGPFKRAIDLQGGALRGRDLTVSGANTGLRARGAEVSLAGASFQGVRGTCAFASGGALRLARSTFSGCEVAVEARDHARVWLQGAVIARCTRTAIAMVQARLHLVDSVVTGPSRDGALMLVGGEAWLDHVRVFRPGPTGVSAHGVTVRVNDLSVWGARAQQGDFGNALFLYDAKVSGAGVWARGCEGPAIEVQLGEGALADVNVEHAGLAALALEHQGQLDVRGLSVRGGAGTGVACIERGRAKITAATFVGVAGGNTLIDTGCQVVFRPAGRADPGPAPR